MATAHHICCWCLKWWVSDLIIDFFWNFILPFCRIPRPNCLRSCQTWWFTVRVFTSTALSTPAHTASAPRCPHSPSPRPRGLLKTQVPPSWGNSREQLKCMLYPWCYYNTLYIFYALFRDRFCAVPHTAAEQDLPSRPEDGVLQLQPAGHVERGLPDRWGGDTLPLNSLICPVSSLKGKLQPLKITYITFSHPVLS